MKQCFEKIKQRFEKRRLTQFARAVFQLDPLSFYGLAGLLKVKVTAKKKGVKKPQKILNEIFEEFQKLDKPHQKELIMIVRAAAEGGDLDGSQTANEDSESL